MIKKSIQMKKHFYIYIIALFLFSSCTKKEVQLPLIDVVGIDKIQNHSSIWVFYKIKKQDTLAVLNKNNKLINTHWIYNIDRRLPMKKVVPILQEMQENRNKDSMHKKEGMLNYFSYANVSSNKISLLDFNNTFFIFSNADYKNIFKNLQKESILELDIQSNKLLLNESKIENNQLIQKIENIQSNDTLANHKMIIKYGKNISYQNYLSVKALLSKTNLKVHSTEYIY